MQDLTPLARARFRAYGASRRRSRSATTGSGAPAATAHLHRHALGDATALGAAALVAATVESPALAAELARASAAKQAA